MSEQDTQQPPTGVEQTQEGSGEGERAQQQNARAFDKRRSGRDRSRHRRGQQPQHGQGQPPRRPDPLLNMDEMRVLVQLINEHGFTEFEFENEDFRIRLRRDLYSQTAAPEISTTPTPTPSSPVAASPSTPATPATQPAAATQPAQQQPGAQPESKASEEDLHIITSPIVGTFYRAASPTSDPFVRMGSQVNSDTVVCIIEAMKLMNEIQAETSGEVAKIYVENGQPVEFGQPLFGVRR